MMKDQKTKSLYEESCDVLFFAMKSISWDLYSIGLQGPGVWGDLRTMPHQSWKIPASLLAQNQEHPGRNQWIPQLIYTKVRCGSKTWGGVSFPCGPSFSKKSKNQKQKANDYEAKKSKWSRQLRLCRRIESVGFTYRRKNRVVMISPCTPRVFGWFRHIRAHMLSRLLTYFIGSRTRSLAHF